MQNKLSVRIGNAVLNHNIERRLDGELYYNESLCLINEEEDNAQVTLYSGNIAFKSGHDFNKINKVGSVIFVDESFFKGFLSKNRVNFDRKKYNIATSAYELTITPKFDVNKDNFTETFNEIINITNQFLKVLGARYNRNCEYFKIPGNKSLSI